MNCLWHQWQISRAADDQRLLPPRTQRHIAHCGHCRTFATQVQAMENLLAGDAPLARIHPSHTASLQFRRIAVAVAAAVIVGIALLMRPAAQRAEQGPPDVPSLAMIVTQSADVMQSPMQRQLNLLASNVTNAAEAVIPPWPTPASASGNAMP